MVVFVVFGLFWFWGFFEGFVLVFDLFSPCLLISNKLRTTFYFFSDILLVSQHALTSRVPAPSPPSERPLSAPAFPLDPKLRRINPKPGSFRPARGKPPPATRRGRRRPRPQAPARALPAQPAPVRHPARRPPAQGPRSRYEKPRKPAAGRAGRARAARSPWQPPTAAPRADPPRQERGPRTPLGRSGRHSREKRRSAGAGGSVRPRLPRAQRRGTRSRSCAATGRFVSPLRGAAVTAPAPPPSHGSSPGRRRATVTHRPRRHRGGSFPQARRGQPQAENGPVTPSRGPLGSLSNGGAAAAPGLGRPAPPEGAEVGLRSGENTCKLDVKCYSYVSNFCKCVLY